MDALSWLVKPRLSTAFLGPSVVLSGNTCRPVNTQNTALRSEAVAAYYYLRVNYPLLGGMLIDRYGDIFCGYFSQVCMHHLGGSLRVGIPICEHRRQSHNYLNDAIHELGCIAIMEDLLPWLTKEAKLEGNSYEKT